MNPKSQKSPLIFRIPLTRIKLVIAGVLYKIIKIFFTDDHRIIKRQGIWYSIDLSEGIDLSLFFLSTFQKHITACQYFLLPDNAVIFDVGANIGIMSLQYAKRYPQGKIYAFEAAESVYKKLSANISLNPELSQRIISVLNYVSDSNGQLTSTTSTYSSWKVGESKWGRHPLHGGIKKENHGTKLISLDEFSRANDITQVDLIKIDTDGHEFKILNGCKKIIQKYNPIIIFEISQYIMAENGFSFQDICNFLSGYGYCLMNSKNGRIIDLKNYYRHIPGRYTIDILALPDKKDTFKTAG